MTSGNPCDGATAGEQQPPQPPADGEQGPEPFPGNGTHNGTPPPGPNGGPPPPGPNGTGGPGDTVTWVSGSIRRPDDLVLLGVAASGFVFRPSPPRLERASSEASLIFELPPQCFGEQAYLQVAPAESFDKPAAEDVEVTSHPGYPDKNVTGQGEPTPSTLPVARIRMAGRSRIAVTAPAEVNSLPLSYHAMLTALSAWPMRLDFNAKPDPAQTGLVAVAVHEAAERLVAMSAASGQGATLEEEFAREVVLLGHDFPTLGETGAGSALASAAAQAVSEAVRADPEFELGPWLPFLIGPREPQADATALELPYRILLSPITPARWRHADTPVGHRGRTELWHSRLTAGDGAGADRPSRVRALWSPDYRPIEDIQELITLISEQPQPPEGPVPNPDLLRMSLDPVDRSMLVTLMAGFDAIRDGGGRYLPVSSEASRLHVTALGALLDAEGNWTTLPADVDLQQWKHLATLGRDQYVRVVYKGFLYPLGHAASLVKVTERQFQPIAPGSRDRIAVLRQRFFIIVRERIRQYDGSAHVHGRRDFPFTQVEILTRVTPDLTDPGMGKSALLSPLPAGLLPRMLFWPMVPAPGTGAMVDVKFELGFTGLAGNRTTVAMPLLFVGKPADDSAAHSAAVKKAYNATAALPRRRAAFGGASVAFAPRDPSAVFDPQLPTESITFRAGDFISMRHPNVHPEVDVARAGVKPIQKLLAQPDYVVELTYPAFYRNAGFAGNAGQVFLQLTRSQPLAFGGAPDQARNDALGALASPQMELLGLSRVLGPVSGASGSDVNAVESALDSIKGGAFDPKTFFKDATILGGIPIAELLNVKHDLLAEDVPKLVTREWPDRIDASFDWVTDVTQSDKAQPPDSASRPGEAGYATQDERRGPDTAGFQCGAGFPGDCDAQQLQGQPVRFHHHLVRGAAFRRGQRPEARCGGGAARKQGSGALRWATRVRQRAPQLHPFERLHRRWCAVGDTQRHQVVVLADAARGAGRPLCPLQRIARGRVQPPVRRQSGHRPLQLLGAPGTVQPHGVLAWRWRLLRHRDLLAGRQRDRGGTGVRGGRRDRPGRRVGKRGNQGRDLLPLAGARTRQGVGGPRRVCADPGGADGHRDHFGLAHLQPPAGLSQGGWPRLGLWRGDADGGHRDPDVQRVGVGEVPARVRRWGSRSKVPGAGAEPGGVDGVLRRLRPGGRLMARQSFVWTALPNGYSEDGQSLRVSVLLSPRLDPQADARRLDSFFPDWENWPARLASARFEIRFGTKVVLIAGTDLTGLERLDDRLGLPDSAVWKAIFTGDRFVRPHTFQDLRGHGVLSYDSTQLAAELHRLYANLAARAGDELPLVSDFLEDEEWGSFIELVSALDARSADRETGLRDPAGQFARFRNSGAESGLAGSGMALLEQFQLFHTPPSRSQVRSEARDDDPRITARWREHARQALPAPADLNKEFDFHQLVAAMGSYPTLLRRLGLVVDLLIDPTHFQPSPDGPLSVSVQFDPGVLTIAGGSDAGPVTRTMLGAARFEAVSDPSAEFHVRRGLLELDPTRFEVLQLDVDGAGLKAMNFARSLGRRRPDERRVDPVTRQEDRLGAPALSSGGIALVHRNRRKFLQSRFATNKTGNDALQGQMAGGSTVVTLRAEDLLRGYRFDIWDGHTGEWRSLCRRSAHYDLGGGVVVTVPEEETTVRLGATKSSDPTTNADLLYLHESVMNWGGWSLAAPQPGRSIRPDDTVDTSQPQSEAVAPPGVNFRSTFRATPGSLPRLRFGRRYAVRARAVDLAGNSLPSQPGDFGPEKPEDRAAPYLRYAPIAAPVIALRSQGGVVLAPQEGESMARMAIRSFNATPDDNTKPSLQVSRRVAVPPRVSVRDAEQHGMLDSGGKMDASRFPLLAHAKDLDAHDPAAAVREVSISIPGPTATAPAVFAACEPGMSLTYLPDPLAIAVAVRLFDHPAIGSSEIITIPLYPEGDWPEALPFEIEAVEDPGAAPTYDPLLRRLRVPLPKAAVIRLRLSMKLPADAMSRMAIFGLLDAGQRAAQRQRALDGQHWMLTPWGELELVHAVQKPLLTPEVTSLGIDRALDATSARPVLVVQCSIASTDRLDLFADWHEPVDRPGDGGLTPPADSVRSDAAFSVKITGPKHYAQQMHGARAGGYGEHVIVGEDLVGINVTSVASHARPVLLPKEHEFHDTRYRRIEYRLEGTSRFREYLPAALLTQEQDGETVPTDANIKVEGSRVVGWIPNSAPPPAPAVLYAVPTFGWTRRTDTEARFLSERRGGGLRIYLDRGWNASGYGEMLAVVLPPAGFTGDPDSEPKGLPYRGYVTQWGNDPVWASAFVKGIAPRRADFPLARVGPDPAGTWLPPGAPTAEADQQPGLFTVIGLRPPRSGQPGALVEVAPHDVFYDGERGLWYCDIVVDTGPSYFPFIRLALARYQPTSCPGAHLSNIVLADIIALTSDRWLSLTPTEDAGTRRLTLYGSRPTGSSGYQEASAAPAMKVFNVLTGKLEYQLAAAIAETNVIEVWIEQLDPALGEDFGWRRIDDVQITAERPEPRRAGAGSSSPPSGSAPQNVLWEGTIGGVAAMAHRRRIVVAEYEEYLVDDERPYDKVPRRKDRRIVYVEHIELSLAE